MMGLSHALSVLVGVLMLAGCAHREVRVDCDRRLTPINAPAPKAKSDASPAPGISRP